MESLFKKNLNPSVIDLSIDRYDAWRTWKKKWEEDKAFAAATLRYIFTDETRNI